MPCVNILNYLASLNRTHNKTLIMATDSISRLGYEGCDQ